MFQSKQFIILLQSIVNVIQQIICQKVAAQKRIPDQQLQALDNKAVVNQRRLARRFGVSQSTIRRNLKKRISVRIHKRRSAPKYKNEDQQQQAKSNCTKTFSRLSIDLGCQKNILH